jgi:hypothetical protein
VLFLDIGMRVDGAFRSEGDVIGHIGSKELIAKRDDSFIRGINIDLFSFPVACFEDAFVVGS